MTVTATGEPLRDIATEEPEVFAAAPGRGRRVVEWLGRRHRLAVELVLVVAVYVLYDGSRGLVAPGRAAAVADADALEALERGAHLAVEHPVQRLVGHLPGLLTAFDLSYMLLHLIATGAVLLWLHRRSARGYVQLRTAVLAASVMSLVCFVVWPTAPPRLAGIGILDTISRSGIDLGSSTMTLFYNPYAAFPSLHESYAALAGWGLWRFGRHRVVRVVGVAYPLWVAAEVLATGNHFLLDIVGGVAVAAAGLAVGRRLSTLPRAEEAGRYRSPANRSSSGTAAPVRSNARTKAS